MRETLTKARRQRAAEHFRSAKFTSHLGMRLSRLAPGEAWVSIPASESLHQYQGLVHGGAIASLADTAATMAALTVLPAESDIVTIEFKMNYLNPWRSGRAIAHGRIVKAGNRVIVVEVSITRPGAKSLVATGTFTMLRFQTQKA
jgi:uncharacterized protein (TIGR00369 family)